MCRAGKIVFMTSRAPLKPPIVYFGGKIRIANRIVGMFPPHRHYVEPYAGSLSVLLAKPPSDHETINDLDGDLMTFWRVLRDRPSDLERVCYLTPHSRAEHQASYSGMQDVDELERARRVWVQLTQGRAGVRSRTGWRHYQDPLGSVSMPRYLSGYIARISPAADRLKLVSLESRPALAVIADYGKHPNVLLYLDPPYMPDTRASGKYRHEMTEGDHIDMLRAIRQCKSAVMLSGYASDLYDRMLFGWDRIEISTRTTQGGHGQDRTEVVWSNRVIPEDVR